MIRIPLGDRHEDDRGVIQDLVQESLDGVTVIFTKRDGVRGNHFHERTFQYSYVIKGELLVATREVGYIQISQEYLHEGELMLSPPFEEHAWKATCDTTVLVLTKGPRSGSDYESDTIRLAPEDHLL